MNKIIISGYSLTGLTTAYILSQLNFPITLIRYVSNVKKLQYARSIALSLFTVDILKKYDIWQDLQNCIEPIKYIRTIDSNSSVVDFAKEEVLGYMVEEQDLLRCLKKFIQFTDVETIDGHITDVCYKNPSYVNVTLNTGVILQAKLLLAADGYGSFIRKALGISHKVYNYKQVAVTFILKHTNHHHNVALEHFTSDGPLAILPLLGGHRSSIVWVENTFEANKYKNLSHEDIIDILSVKIGSYLGDLKIDSPILRFNLSASLADKLYDRRVCLLGDAAHTAHPLAGQGFNLTVAGVWDLHNKLHQVKYCGGDIGIDSLLSDYSDKQTGRAKILIFLTDNLNSLFLLPSFPFFLIRKISMAIVNNSNKVKNLFINYATGMWYK